MPDRATITHVLKEGQDLFMLAELYYGDFALWWVIYHANQAVIGDDPEDLIPGTELTVPLLEISKTKGELPSDTGVRDPLIALAEDFYGDPAMYFDVLDANSLQGHELLTVGQEISLPARGSKPLMRTAEFWRNYLYREPR